MKIDIRDLFENYEDTEIELQSDGDFDAEKIIRMTRRELRRKVVRRVAAGVAATAAVMAVVVVAGFGVSRETNTAKTHWGAGDGQGVVNTVSSWIGEFFSSLKAQKVDYGDQKKEPGMTNWDSTKQGILLEYEEEEPSQAEEATQPESEPESESQMPAYLVGPAVGEKIVIAAVRYGYVPEDGRDSGYQAQVTIKDRLQSFEYSEEEIDASWSKEDQTQAYIYVTKEAKPSLDYMIQVLQPYEVETRIFSFQGEVTIHKNEMLGEWEATWLTVDQNQASQEAEKEYEEMSEEAKDWWQQIDHHLLLYHPEKHYLINLSVDARVHDMEELDKMAADIVVVESEMAANQKIHEVVACPDQTFGLNAVLG